MALQGNYIQDGNVMDFTPVAACAAGDVVQLPGGLAGLCSSAMVASQKGSVMVSGIVEIAKKANIALLAGGDVYWDVSASVANFKPDSGTTDFYVGTVAEDAAAAATTVKVRLNHVTRYEIDLERGGQEWTQVLTGSGPPTLTVMAGGYLKANIINTNEAQAVTLISNRTVLPTAKPIMEFKMTRVAASGSASDFDIGLASAVSTTDFDAVAIFAAVHLDGGDNNIDTHSDDGNVDRALADSGIDDVDGTYFEGWVDARDDTNVKIYIEGVLVDTSALPLVLTAALATGIRPVFSLEKSTGTETAEGRVSRMRVRTMAE